MKIFFGISLLAFGLWACGAQLPEETSNNNDVKTELTTDETANKPENELVEKKQQQSEQEIVTQIRQWFAQTIEKEHLMQRDTTFPLGYTTEGTEMVSYKLNGDLARLKVSMYGETGYMVEDYYVKDGQMYFAYIQNHIYNTHMLDPEFDASKTTVKEDRFYYNNQTLIRWVNNQKEQVPIDGLAREKEQYYLKYFKEFLEQMPQ